jgi:serine protease Do
MKLNRSLLFLPLLALWPAASAAEKDPVGGDLREMPNKGPRRTMDYPAEKEIVTFLGVETRPVSPTLTAQLSLARDAGLVVASLVPGSPAAGVLQPHDILLKLDDQLLVETRQFSVLVRNRREGDEVMLTFVRAARENKVKVKLGKHEVPKLPLHGAAGFGAEPFDILVNPPGVMHGMPREDADRVLGLLQQGLTVPGMAPGAVKPAHRMLIERQHAPGFRATSVNPNNSTLVLTDDRGAMEITIRDGKKSLVVKNPQGGQIFSGPVNTPGEREALQPELRARLDEVEGMQEFTFRTDGEFQPAEVRAFPPMRQGIVFPHAEVHPLPAPAF